jgi:hypothetical protein
VAAVRPVLFPRVFGQSQSWNRPWEDFVVEGFVVDLANPFPLHEWVEPGLPMGPPVVYDVEVRGITIQNFRNNGLFTERVDGFTFVDVETNHIPGYGIFPTLSKNGSIRQSRASGSDDSGICAPAPGLTFPWMANPGWRASSELTVPATLSPATPDTRS